MIVVMVIVLCEVYVFIEMWVLVYCDIVILVGNGCVINLLLVIGWLLIEVYLMVSDCVLLIGVVGGYVVVLLLELVVYVVVVESDLVLLVLVCELFVGFDNVELVEGLLEGGYVGGVLYDVLVVDGVIEMVFDVLVL